MQDGGRTAPNASPLLSNENPKSLKTGVYAFKGTQFLCS